MLYRVSYISTCAGLPTEEDLDDILATAIHCNHRDGITGLLLYHDGNFFQMLEGERIAVLDCYARIKADTRHSHVITLISEPTPERAFGDWHMAFVPVNKLDRTLQDGFFNILSLREPGSVSALTDNRTAAVLTRSFINSLGDSLS